MYYPESSNNQEDKITLPEIPHPKGSVVSAKQKERLAQKRQDKNKKNERLNRYWALFWLLLLIGSTIFVAYVTTSTGIVCSKAQDICEVKEQHLWETSFKTKSTFRLSSVFDAYLKQDRDDDGNSIYCLVIRTKQGGRIYPFGNWYSSNHEALQTLANDINHFLNNNQEVLDRKQDPKELRHVFFVVVLAELFPVIRVFFRMAFGKHPPSDTENNP